MKYPLARYATPHLDAALRLAAEIAAARYSSVEVHPVMED